MICDLIIIGFMLISFIVGWKKGFVRSVYSVISVLICIVATYFLGNTVSQYLAKTEWGIKLGEFLTSTYVGFVAEDCSRALFTVVSAIIVYFATKLILKFALNILDALASLPLISFFNQLLGLVLNGAVGAVWVVILVNLLYSVPQTQSAISESEIVRQLGILFLS